MRSSYNTSRSIIYSNCSSSVSSGIYFLYTIYIPSIIWRNGVGVCVCGGYIVSKMINCFSRAKGAPAKFRIYPLPAVRRAAEHKIAFLNTFDIVRENACHCRSSSRSRSSVLTPRTWLYVFIFFSSVFLSSSFSFFFRHRVLSASIFCS